MLVMVSAFAHAQNEDRPVAASSFIVPAKPSQVVVPFSINGEGHRFNPIWGLDQAWINEQNLRKGINHMGRENVGIGRSAFRTRKALVDGTELPTDHINALTSRNKIFNIVSDTLPLVLTADQEAGVDAFYRTGTVANTDRWARMIDAHVRWLNENSKHRVVGVSPFNEPDYWTEEGATAINQGEIAKKLKQDYPLFKDIAIVGANTLNDDKAVAWYQAGKDYFDWGNTHQLAGSMDNYKAFHQLLARDGKVGYNDEMHNVAEAFIGLEYGMTVGIWWGFDSRARGEFCDISRHGVRLGYGEHPNNWTAATVYRHDDGRVKAFLGSSERQAYTTTYQLVSTDRDVYYDGVGPTREIQMTIHGGTGYQKGQKNAERVIDVTWGEDVQPSPINGTYMIMNKATNFVVAEHGESGGHPNISQEKYSGKANQQWVVEPVGSKVDGDYSFHDIRSVNDGKRMDVLNFSTESGANVISFNSDAPSSNQQWYLNYAGDGYYYIRNRESALYLTLSSSTKLPGININQQTKMDDPTRQLWRFLPIDAECETEAPQVPTGLKATAQNASILLEWTPNQETDLDGYMVLRAVKGTDEWNTIARKLKTTKFLDNGCQQQVDYVYRVKAIDHSENQSAPSESVEAATLPEKGMIARWSMEDDLLDQTDNLFDAVWYDKPVFTGTHIEGDKSLSLNGTSQYVQLPYMVASSNEMTFSAWIYWRNSSVANQRLFDFGNGPDAYMYLTPSDGSAVAFVYHDGNGDRKLQATQKLSSLRWIHMALTVSSDSVVIYIDGEKVAHSSDLNVTPADLLPSLNYIGRGQKASDAMLKAYVDDVRMFNCALTAEQVKTVMDGATNGIIQWTDHQQPAPYTYYNMSGMRIDQPVGKGVYLRNDGKKIVIK